MSTGPQRWIAWLAAMTFGLSLHTAAQPPASGVPAAPSTDLSSSRTVRILCLGDSMTAGDESNPTSFRSYRGRLFALLSAAGHKVDFVGTVSTRPAIGGDADHDGYGGATIGPGGSPNNLADRLGAVLSATEPDVVILAFGWNSVYNEADIAGSRYRQFVERLSAMRPTTQLVVATLSPQRGQSEARSAALLPGYAALNSAARTIARSSASDQIHLADLAAAGFQSADYHDVIHWSQSGADRAAQVIFRTLVDGPLRR